MDSCRTRLLQDSADGILHILGRNHHEIRQLINDNDDKRKFFLRIPSIERLDVTNAMICKNRIAFLHLLYCPVQHRRCLLRIGHNRNHEMRNPIVIRKFNHLGVDQNKLHFIRRCLEQNTRDQGVDAHGLTRACCTCHQEMRHFPNIRKNRLSADIHAEANGEF